MSATRQELQKFLNNLDLALEAPLRHDTSLISSGALDSAALFDLILWVEQRTGRSIDPTRLDFATQWDSIEAIADYVDAAHVE